MDGFSNIHKRLLQVLSDGHPHTREELRLALEDSEATYNNVRYHLSKLRDKLRPIGQDVVCVKLMAMKTAYRHVLVLNHPANSHLSAAL